MFSEAVNLLDELDATITSILDKPEELEKSILRARRRMIIQLIGEIGREEYIPIRQSANIPSIDLLGAIARKIQNNVIDSKIEYVVSLFSMVPDRNISLFYNDLKSGLDAVVERWDDNPIHPRTHNYRHIPQRVKKRTEFRVVRRPR